MNKDRYITKAERLNQEVNATSVVHSVLKDFKACGIIVAGLSDTQMGMAIADAAQHIENYMPTERIEK